jgi:hypothetical protein
MPLYGPNALQIISTDGVGWAQRCLQWASQMPLYGPNTLCIIPTDGVESAQHRFSAGAHDALVWAQRTPNYFHRWHRLGLASSSAGVPDALRWAQYTPNYSHSGVEWAQHCFRRVPPMPCMGPTRSEFLPPMASAGPSIVFGGCPQCPCMGPTQITPTDGVEWAQHCFQRVPPMPLHGPNAL